MRRVHTVRHCHAYEAPHLHSCESRRREATDPAARLPEGTQSDASSWYSGTPSGVRSNVHRTGIHVHGGARLFRCLAPISHVMTDTRRAATGHIHGVPQASVGGVRAPRSLADGHHESRQHLLGHPTDNGGTEPRAYSTQGHGAYSSQLQTHARVSVSSLLTTWATLAPLPANCTTTLQKLLQVALNAYDRAQLWVTGFTQADETCCLCRCNTRDEEQLFGPRPFQASSDSIDGNQRSGGRNKDGAHRARSH
jgi:hypothetical protein